MPFSKLFRLPRAPVAPLRPAIGIAGSSPAMTASLSTATKWGLVIAALTALALAVPIGTRPAAAQGAARQPSSPLVVPGFWDPRRLPERSDVSRMGTIRFMTEVDYPPFNFAGPDGNPAGFNVDLARMICEELKVNCRCAASTPSMTASPRTAAMPPSPRSR
jgi:Bacterial extracellular solute-binding proteins, family 3